MRRLKISAFFRVKMFWVKFMGTYTVEILEPKAKKILDDLANLNLIKIQRNENPKKRSVYSAV